MHNNIDTELWEAFCEDLGINITEDYHVDLELGELSTADGYEIFYLGKANDLNYDSDLFYYRPSFDEIVERIKEYKSFDDDIVEVACYDVDEWFDEYEVMDYLQSNLDEDKLIALGLQDEM